ncbi:MAG: ParA family protein [Clostridiaceae bacterium]|mgnify:CR=1 FL=1|jgi:chromosome partitioning protein|nr:ParA family protein [Clostridiaceae bacterium]
MIIAVANQKGGVGKSTTCINLASALAERGKRVLLVDSDPQGNTTSGFGISKKTLDISMYDVFVNEASLCEEAILNIRKRLDIIPATIDLVGAEVELVDVPERAFRLRRRLDKCKDRYNYIVIDCPPSLGLLTVNALTAADTVLIPVQAEYYALEGLMQLMTTLDLVKRGYNPDLRLAGVFITMFDTRTQLSKQVKQEVAWYFQDNYLETFIPRNVRLSEAPSFGQTIFEYDDRSKGAKSYRKLADELLRRFSSEQWKDKETGAF